MPNGSIQNYNPDNTNPVDVATSDMLNYSSNYAGLWLVRRTPTELFFRIAYVLMLLIAIELIRGAVVEMARG